MRRSPSRTTTKKFLWAVLALAMLATVLVLGTGTGGNGATTTTGSAVLPLLWLRRRPLLPAARR